MTPLACKYCLYFDVIDDQENVGLCRRHAPQLQESGVAGWPMVGWEDWCGEGRTVESAEPLVEIHKKWRSKNE